MKKEKILIVSVVVMGSLAFGSQVWAAQLVPQNAPLQPMPTNTAPNVSNNINTPDSQTNQALQEESKAAEQSQLQELPAAPDQEVPTDMTAAPIIPATPTIGIYWGLLILGLLGLAISGLWAYFRFVRKDK